MGDQNRGGQRRDRRGRVPLSMALEGAVGAIEGGAGLYATHAGHAVCIIMAWP
jgi:hypothetical protein